MENFIQEAIRTESPNCYPVNQRVLHAAMGCVTESAELMDAIKKSMFYGKELDLVNIKEEAADILWYLAILFDELDFSFSEGERMVIEKLRKRFPEKFTEEKAEDRDLITERSTLESFHKN